MSKMSLIMTLPVLIAAMLSNISGCSDPAANDVLQIETIQEIFPSATNISELSISRDVQTSRRPGNQIISEIRDSSGMVGYCVESELVSRSGPFRIRVFLDQQLVVKRVIVTSYPWERGRDVRKWAFTSQFEGKGPNDAIEIDKDIDAMTGATISSRVMSEGIREAIKTLNDIKANQAVKTSGRL